MPILRCTVVILYPTTSNLADRRGARAEIRTASAHAGCIKGAPRQDACMIPFLANCRNLVYTGLLAGRAWSRSEGAPAGRIQITNEGVSDKLHPIVGMMDWRHRPGDPRIPAFSVNHDREAQGNYGDASLTAH